MSVPREILDQLLSGHLDGALSVDEKNQIEQLLRDNPSVARELDELRELRITMREIHRIDSRVNLDDGFADRVLSAAVAQAKTEGLGDDHPLVRLTEKPSRPEPKRIPLLRIAGAIVALAASIAVAIVVMQPPKKPIKIALLDPVKIAPSDQTDGDQPNVSVNSTAEMIAVDTPNPIISATPKNDPVAAPELVETPGTIDPPKLATNPNVKVEFTEVDMQTLMQLQALGARGSYLFVIKVKRSELGKSNRCVRESLKASGLAKVKEKELTEDMVGFLAESADENVTAQVMFLEASSKKVDVFVNRLFADTAGIRTVGLGMAQTSSIIRVADALRQDPTTVHQSSSWELQGSGLSALIGEIGRHKIPMRSTKANVQAPLTATSADDPDGISQVLIWIQ